MVVLKLQLMLLVLAIFSRHVKSSHNSHSQRDWSQGDPWDSRVRDKPWMSAGTKTGGGHKMKPDATAEEFRKQLHELRLLQREKTQISKELEVLKKQQKAAQEERLWHELKGTAKPKRGRKKKRPKRPVGNNLRQPGNETMHLGKAEEEPGTEEDITNAVQNASKLTVIEEEIKKTKSNRTKKQERIQKEKKKRLLEETRQRAIEHVEQIESFIEEIEKKRKEAVEKIEKEMKRKIEVELDNMPEEKENNEKPVPKFGHGKFGKKRRSKAQRRSGEEIVMLMFE